jgi:hypothetical protein
LRGNHQKRCKLDQENQSRAEEEDHAGALITGAERESPKTLQVRPGKPKQSRRRRPVAFITGGESLMLHKTHLDTEKNERELEKMGKINVKPHKKVGQTGRGGRGWGFPIDPINN